ncbi:50S ribosomal protein L22 [Candidatus Gottesmanbacteria bacterium]|nr:50S ribosomal protein L22 [Candidatus Gottesmanbacteria bacterium]
MHISPKKMKALARIVVGLNPADAVEKLLLGSGKGTRLLLQAIKSAQADAQNNLKLDVATLTIKSVSILKGPAMKRFQPVSRGMAHSIKKRMSHITVVLTQKEAKVVKKLEEPKKENI